MSEQRRNWVGFDLGGTKMLSCVFDEDLKPLERKRRKTKGHEGIPIGFDRIARTIERTLEEAGLSKESVAGIGIGCPGPIDLEKGIILEAPNLGWKDAPIKKFLERELGCPVVVMNDVDAGVYGEYRFGAGENAHCVVGVFPGTGIGAGCVYEGAIFRGTNASCFELGHVQVEPDGELCGCGQHGCLETVASRLAISSAVTQSAYRGQSPHVMKVAGTDLANIRSGILAEAVKKDRAVEIIVRNAARKLGIAVSNLVNLLLPDVVILGGGLVEAMPELYVAEVREAAVKRVVPSYRKSFRVVAAKLGDDAAILGAAAWARHQIAGTEQPPAAVVASE